MLSLVGEVDVVGVAKFAEAAEDAGGVGLGAGEETAGEGFANVLGSDDGGAIPGGADFEEVPEVAGKGLVGIGLGAEVIEDEKVHLFGGGDAGAGFFAIACGAAAGVVSPLVELKDFDETAAPAAGEVVSAEDVPGGAGLSGATGAVHEEAEAVLGPPLTGEGGAFGR